MDDYERHHACGMASICGFLMAMGGLESGIPEAIGFGLLGAGIGYVAYYVGWLIQNQKKD